MKKTFVTICISFIIFSSCTSQTKYGKPEVDPTAVQKTFLQWWNYHYKNIMLTRDFVALDDNSKPISKDEFLNQLTQGYTIPIRLISNDGLYYYKLFKIKSTSDSSIKATMVAAAVEEYEHYKMEGQLFPPFHFTDLNGNVLTNETLKGKIIVIKCWYIHCAACVKEFPAVNKMVMDYKDRKDIVFVSLAEDTPEQLNVFLARKPLMYAVVPNMKIYMNSILHLNSFPTHFIINKQGKIAKVLMDSEGLEVALSKESKL